MTAQSTQAVKAESKQLMINFKAYSFSKKLDKKNKHDKELIVDW